MPGPRAQRTCHHRTGDPGPTPPALSPRCHRSQPWPGTRGSNLGRVHGAEAGPSRPVAGETQARISGSPQNSRQHGAWAEPEHPAGLVDKPARPWTRWKPDVLLPQASRSAGFLMPSFKSQSRRTEIKAFLPRKSTSNALRDKAGTNMDARTTRPRVSTCTRTGRDSPEEAFHGDHLFPSL